MLKLVIDRTIQPHGKIGTAPATELGNPGGRVGLTGGATAPKNPLESSIRCPHISFMRGRYAGFLAPLFRTVNPRPNLKPTWNMAPTLGAPVVRLTQGDRHLDVLNWGLIPYFTKDLK
jgi:hypothetical protein